MAEKEVPVHEDLVTKFAKEASLNPKSEARLRGLIDSAIEERFQERADIRVGRIVGAAMATQI